MILPRRSPDLILLGASTRSAAFSAIRAGFQPVCIDQFADQDLMACADVRLFPERDEDLLGLLRSFPGLPVVYIGGIENRPDLLELISQEHPLWGMPAEIVRQARNHQNLVEIARIARVGLPEMLPASNPPEQDGTWLIRPQRSGGGRGIQIWKPDVEARALQEEHFFQKRIAGQSFSAIFISSPGPGDVRFVGMTYQVQTSAEVLGTDFLWQGSYGPAALDISVELNVRRFGNVAKWKLGLIGVFGVDFVLDESDQAWVTEINPRYPASQELLEHITGVPLFLEHCRCFSKQELPDSQWSPSQREAFLAKIVVYSPDDLTLSEELVADAEVDPLRFPQFADLPAAHQSFRLGDPVCTVYAEAQSIESLHSLIKTKTDSITDKMVAIGCRTLS